MSDKSSSQSDISERDLGSPCSSLSVDEISSEFEGAQAAEAENKENLPTNSGNVCEPDVMDLMIKDIDAKLIKVCDQPPNELMNIEESAIEILTHYEKNLEYESSSDRENHEDQSPVYNIEKAFNTQQLDLIDRWNLALTAGDIPSENAVKDCVDPLSFNEEELAEQNVPETLANVRSEKPSKKRTRELRSREPDIAATQKKVKATQSKVSSASVPVLKKPKEDTPLIVIGKKSKVAPAPAQRQRVFVTKQEKEYLPPLIIVKKVATKPVEAAKEAPKKCMSESDIFNAIVHQASRLASSNPGGRRYPERTRKQAQLTDYNKLCELMAPSPAKKRKSDVPHFAPKPLRREIAPLIIARANKTK